MKDWKQHPLDHIHVEYWDDADIYKWKAVMIGPRGTPYRGHYTLNIDLSPNYPHHPMNVRFLTKIYCCNVSEDGMISTDLFGENQWTSKQTVKSILESIYHKCLIEAGDYDYNCVLRVDLNKLLYQQTEQFVINALQWNEQYAKGICAEFYNFPQIDSDQFEERLNAMISVIDGICILSKEMIVEYLMPFVCNQESDCGLYEFIEKFKTKQKYQGTVLNEKQVSERVDHDFTINIKLLSGEMERVNVKSSDSVYYLKQLLAMKLQTPLKQQLLFNGKQLDDGRTLSEYEVVSDSIIHLVIRCRGG